jgi:hypothetical protein
MSNFTLRHYVEFGQGNGERGREDIVLATFSRPLFRDFLPLLLADGG